MDTGMKLGLGIVLGIAVVTLLVWLAFTGPLAKAFLSTGI